MTSPVYSNLDLTATFQRSSESRSVEFERQGAAQSTQISVSNTVTSSSTTVDIQLVQPVDEVSALDRPDPEQAANNILQFISTRLAQLQADGASAEELQAKLDAAREGFEQGVAESREILSSLGLLSEEQEGRIDRVIARFNEGIADIEARLFGGENAFEQAVQDETQQQVLATAPVPTGETVESSNAVSPSASTPPSTAGESGVPGGSTVVNTVDDTSGSRFIANYQASRIAFLSQQSIDLELTTQDGDLVSVSFFASQGGAADSRSFSLGDGSASRQISLQFGATELQISVLGDIDDGELSALEELLSQLSDVANAFFNGYGEDALSQSLALDVDYAEIAQFSFELQSREIQTISQSYREVAALGDKPGKSQQSNGRGIGLLLQQLRERALEQSSVSFEEQFVEQLLSVTFAAASASTEPAEDGESDNTVIDSAGAADQETGDQETVSGEDPVLASV